MLMFHSRVELFRSSFDYFQKFRELTPKCHSEIRVHTVTVAFQVSASLTKKVNIVKEIFHTTCQLHHGIRRCNPTRQINILFGETYSIKL